jgi:hypothetical protein
MFGQKMCDETEKYRSHCTSRTVFNLITLNRTPYKAILNIEHCKVTYLNEMYQAPPIDESRCPFHKFLPHSSNITMY